MRRERMMSARGINKFLSFYSADSPTDSVLITGNYMTSRGKTVSPCHALMKQ